jgi:hypothetical protein
MTDASPPVPEEVLNKMIGFLEGPMNRVAERVLSSKVVLVPASLVVHVTLRGVRFARRQLKGKS